MRRHFAYLKYVLRHKWFVFWAGIGLGVPIITLLLHDWDKFLPDEWFPYAKTFYKPDGSKQYVESVEFARAWMLHQHRNKHHWQWWLWIEFPCHNYADKLPKTEYLMWDRGDLQWIAERNSGGVTWYEVRDPVEGDKYAGADEMSDLYRREMLADWIGAGKALGKPYTWEWYEDNKDKMKLHPDTRSWIEEQLEQMRVDFMRRSALGI